MRVVGVVDGRRTVLRQIEPQSFDPDYTVGENEDYSSLKAAVQEASTNGKQGDTVAVERGTYSVDNLVISENTKVVGEEGTTITDSNTGDSSTSTVTVKSESVLSNVNVDANGESNAISATDNSQLISIEETGGVTLDSSSVRRTSDRLLNIQPTTTSSTTQVKTKTVDISKTVEGNQVVTFFKDDGDIRKFELTITLDQPTDYYGVSLRLQDKNGNRVATLLKKNTFGNYYAARDLGGQLKNIAGTANKGKTTVKLVYKDNTLKLYHDGQLVGKNTIKDISRLTYDGDASAHSLTADGTIVVEQEQTSSSSSNTKQVTFDKKYSGDKSINIIKGDQVKKFDLKFTMYQPTDYFGLRFRMNKNQDTIATTTKTNSYYDSYYVKANYPNDQHKLDGTGGTKTTVRVVYKDGVFKIYHNGALEDKQTIGKLTQLVYDGNAPDHWMRVKGTVTIKK